MQVRVTPEIELRILCLVVQGFPCPEPWRARGSQPWPWPDVPPTTRSALSPAVSVIQSIPVFNESGRFSFTLPAPVKIKVRFSFFLQVYLILLFLGECGPRQTFCHSGGQSHPASKYTRVFACRRVRPGKMPQSVDRGGG